MITFHCMVLHIMLVCEWKMMSHVVWVQLYTNGSVALAL